MAVIANSHTAETSVLFHRPLHKATREAVNLLNGLASNTTEEAADIGTNRRRATLEEGGGLATLTLLPVDRLTTQDIRTRLRYRNAVKFHVKELERKLKKITKDGAPNSADDIQHINGLLTKLKDLPFYKEPNPLSYAHQVEGFGTKNMLRAKMSEAAIASRLWIREHQVAGVPILGAVFVAKMTVGLWLLSEFDKVFHSHATSGNPIPQGFSLPGLSFGMKQAATAPGPPQPIYPQGGMGNGGYYPAYQPSAPPMPGPYGSGLY